ncbi:MAG: thiamine pyrophosphate-binding protein, partial [Defluviitaleaceae bacterium]|nr:thiamine pyrophosphate-binding protein [Defluviitaleaceae bacterium]
MTRYKSGEAFIDILNAHGVDKFFINPGGEFIELQSVVASARVAGKKAPQLVLCLDEAVTIAAAYGNYMVTGKPQVVLVHSELGTLQLGGNMQNLQWGRVPTVIMTAWQEIDVRRTLWNGQPYDQGSILRNNVKYDRFLKGDEDLHEVMQEAFRIACTEPTGPVYLYFPMAYFYKEIEKPASPPAPAEIPALPAFDPAVLAEMADILLEAKNPLLVSGNAGRYPENVAALVKLAETLGASVLTGYSWMNFPSDHPLCVGIEQIGGSRKQDAGYDDADVILAVDYAMPYVSSAPLPRPDARILHIDIDPFTQGRLLWERGADIFIRADARKAIPALEKLLQEKITPVKKLELMERYQRIDARNGEIRRGWYEAAQSLAGESPISPDYLCYCINQVIDDDAIFVNHTLSHCASVTEQIVRRRPGTWFGCPSGAIGWAPGAALGAASAAPGRLVAAIMTDGGFVWGCPTSTLWTSGSYRFPFLAVICNNQGYGVVRGSQQSMLEAGGFTEEY